jgi:hypothetical protein
MRSLSHEEYDEAEMTKTKIFLSLDPLCDVTEEMVLAKLNTINSIDINNKYSIYKNFAKNIAAEINRPLTAEENKFTKSYTYQLVYTK